MSIKTDPGIIDINAKNSLRQELISDDLSSLLLDGDVLLILPPFADWHYGSLACHLLQACAREVGIRVSVLYANILLAAMIGKDNYGAVTFDYHQLIGEKFFARAAYGLPPFGSFNYKYRYDGPNRQKGFQYKPDFSELKQLEDQASEWTDNVAQLVVQKGFKLVGCSTTFQQTAASVALLNSIKNFSPETVTFIGGANCEGEMAEGIASLNAKIDYIFSGESEVSFPNFLKQILSGKPPLDQIIYGSPCINLDALPTPVYTEYFEQLEYCFPDALTKESLEKERIFISYETSRGCWWGQKHHCTFCGLNGTGIKFREKSADKAITELKKLIAESPVRNIHNADNIMPYNYFKTLIPRLENELKELDISIFYEQKANLTLEKVIALKKARVVEIQPGIESLSSSLLKHMNKGTSASQNIALLRYCRSVGIRPYWNLLWSFPEDKLLWYEEMLELLPLLRHLNPPGRVSKVVIDRFSPYFYNSANYGVTNTKPSPIYSMYESLLSQSDLEKLVYHFVADYKSESLDNPKTVELIRREIKQWADAWYSSEGQVPNLAVQRLSNNVFILIDTRGLPGTEKTQFLSFEEALVVLCGSRRVQTKAIEWAQEHKLVVELDGWFVPLAIAEPELLQELETVDRQRRLKGLKDADCNF